MQQILVPQLLAEYGLTREHVTCIECLPEDIDDTQLLGIKTAIARGRAFLFLKVRGNEYGTLYCVNDGYVMDIDSDSWVC